MHLLSKKHASTEIYGGKISSNNCIDMNAVLGYTPIVTFIPEPKLIFFKFSNVKYYL